MSKEDFKIIIIKLYYSFIYVIKFLISNIYGILILSIILYYYSNSIGLGKPYSFSELITWFNALPENSKTSVFTSIITISGFLVAFSIGSSHQRELLLSQMKIDASKDIEKFFTQASRNVTSVNIYAKYLIEIVELIKNDADNETINFHLSNVLAETQKFIHTRSKIQEQAIEAHRFKGKYSIILASSWGATQKMDLAVNALTNITQNIYFEIPILRLDDPYVKKTYLRQISIEQCNNYINSYENNYYLMNSLSGGLSGGMIASTIGINFSFILNFLKLDFKKI